MKKIFNFILEDNNRSYYEKRNNMYCHLRKKTMVAKHFMS